MSCLPRQAVWRMSHLLLQPLPLARLPFCLALLVGNLATAHGKRPQLALVAAGVKGNKCAGQAPQTASRPRTNAVTFPASMAPTRPHLLPQPCHISLQRRLLAFQSPHLLRRLHQLAAHGQDLVNLQGRGARNVNWQEPPHPDKFAGAEGASMPMRKEIMLCMPRRMRVLALACSSRSRVSCSFCRISASSVASSPLLSAWPASANRCACVWRQASTSSGGNSFPSKAQSGVAVRPASRGQDPPGAARPHLSALQSFPWPWTPIFLGGFLRWVTFKPRGRGIWDTALAELQKRGCGRPTQQPCAPSRALRPRAAKTFRSPASAR
jgi:hypothetical protein